MTENPSDLPEVGTEVLVQVLQSPTRTTLFPEQSIIASAGSEAVEIIFVRNEIMMSAQRGKVRSAKAGGIELEIVAAPMMAHLTDIGHVRMPVQASIDLALNVLKHVVINHGIDPKALSARLTKEVRKPK